MLVIIELEETLLLRLFAILSWLIVLSKTLQICSCWDLVICNQVGCSILASSCFVGFSFSSAVGHCILIGVPVSEILSQIALAILIKHRFIVEWLLILSQKVDLLFQIVYFARHSLLFLGKRLIEFVISKNSSDQCGAGVLVPGVGRFELGLTHSTMLAPTLALEVSMLPCSCRTMWTGRRWIIGQGCLLKLLDLKPFICLLSWSPWWHCDQYLMLIWSMLRRCVHPRGPSNSTTLVIQLRLNPFSKAFGVLILPVDVRRAKINTVLLKLCQLFLILRAAHFDLVPLRLLGLSSIRFVNRPFQPIDLRQNDVLLLIILLHFLLMTKICILTVKLPSPIAVSTPMHTSYLCRRTQYRMLLHRIRLVPILEQANIEFNVVLFTRCLIWSIMHAMVCR